MITIIKMSLTKKIESIFLIILYEKSYKIVRLKERRKSTDRIRSQMKMLCRKCKGLKHKPANNV